ncbi:hypothetical protein [Heterosigma akashiwo virus 01]|jgi:hypothetical protein|uniref:HIT domain-containing protein n=1 Tax=Heterosigma akashiwo virus 01 TaxID=97195 RepID=A0A1C9C4Y4_HAV01|nr:hypothetical protein D1R72_gp016 [Heterosigma akashiwo virus 01]AOM63347.1 hypothetical protein [Heterosigma akashiwo virus 01]
MSLSEKKYQHQHRNWFNEKNQKRRKHNNKRKCYTCFPRQFHERFKITETENVRFLFDVAKRPMIIVTTLKHYNNMFEVEPDEYAKILDDIKNFCELRNIRDFSISVNFGKWQTHHHFHIKLRTYERQVKIMRDDHFKVLKLESNYETNNENNQNDNKECSI